MRRPTCISRGPGESTSKFSHGGVRTSRLVASAKNGKTWERGWGSQSSVFRRVASTDSSLSWNRVGATGVHDSVEGLWRNARRVGVRRSDGWLGRGAAAKYYEMVIALRWGPASLAALVRQLVASTVW